MDQLALEGHDQHIRCREDTFGRRAVVKHDGFHDIDEYKLGNFVAVTVLNDRFAAGHI